MANSCIEPKVAPVRTPDKLDPVGEMVKKLFPGQPYMVLLWNPAAKDKTFVEMITNCGLDEAADLLMDCAGHMKPNSLLRKAGSTKGHACWAILFATVIEAVM